MSPVECVLVPADPPVVADSDIWPSPGSDMYRPHCEHSVHNLGGIYCLSLVGWLFTIVFTYLGFAMMITGQLVSPEGRPQFWHWHCIAGLAYLCTPYQAMLPLLLSAESGSTNARHDRKVLSVMQA